jgi:hypothetical protein
MWRYFVIRLTVTDAQFINKSSLFILLLGVIRQAGTEAEQRTKSRAYIRRPAI